jgi:hypothetical protein
MNESADSLAEPAVLFDWQSRFRRSKHMSVNAVIDEGSRRLLEADADESRWMVVMLIWIGRCAIAISRRASLLDVGRRATNRGVRVDG